MALINSYFTPLQSQEGSYRFITEEEEEEGFCGEEECNLSRETARSIESLNTLLLNLPDIEIPELLYNPLPLQCLAANALPESVRLEIDGVLKEYSSVICTSPGHFQSSGSSHALAKSNECDGESGSCIEGGSQTGLLKDESDDVFCSPTEKVMNTGKAEDLASEDNSDKDHIVLHCITIKIGRIVSDNINDFGAGFQVTGGVKCNSCKTLHTVVTLVSADSVSPIIREGVSIKEWSGKDLEDCTFEDVKVFFKNFVKSNTYEEVEIVVKECRGKLISRPKSLGIETGGGGGLALFESWPRQKRYQSKSRESLQVPLRNDDTDSSGDPSSDRSRPSSTEFLDTTSAFTFPQNPTRSRNSSCSSPSPPPESLLRNASRSLSPFPLAESVPKTGNGTVEVSIPRLDSNARALSAAMEAGRPKSPRMKEEGMFSRFPNGMIQLSLKYNSELDDLQVTLHRVKGQSSKEMGDLNDVFINTYIIPDTRSQGVRSIPVTNSSSPGVDSSSNLSNGSKALFETSYSYMLNKTELETTVLRIILWDATKSKKITFRGEVLLCLANDEIISLNDQPVWITVCPLDPNLPSLPEPVHYKQQKTKNVEYIFSKFKQKAQAIAHITSGNIKLSSSLWDLGTDKGSLRGESKTFRKAKSGSSYRPQLMEILDSKMRDTSSHTINEAKLAKLNSILNVLRASEEADDAGTTHEKNEPEFLSIFDPEKHGNKNRSSSEKKRRNKSSKSVLKVLHEDVVGPSSDSEDLIDDGPLSSSLNEQTLAWLGTRKSKTRGTGHRERPRSDSFQRIPKLRESLNAGRRNRISNYTFDNQNEEKVSSHEDHVTSKDTHKQRHMTSKGTREQSHMTSTEQMHYRVDTKSLTEEVDSPPLHTKSQKFSVSEGNQDCNCYPSPVQVSFNRISITDVDKVERKEEEIERCRTMSCNKRNTSKNACSKSLKTVHEARTSRGKTRSKSLGDMDDLESGEEVLIIRTPVHHLNGNKYSEYMKTVNCNSLPTTRHSISDEEEKDDEAVSSLDFKGIHNQRHSLEGHQQQQQQQQQQQERFSRSFNRADSKEMSSNGDMREHQSSSMSRCRSLDNLIDSVPANRSKAKGAWKNSYLYTSSSHGNQDSHEKDGRNVGSAKLELAYNDLNPQQPVLIVKLLDILFQSSKNLSSEFLMKCQMVHSSTGVCILKNKTVVNIKNPMPSAPLGLLQFQTDIVNLSLEISFLSFGILFSKKEIGHISLELNPLNLNRDSPHCEWLPIIKDLVHTS